MRVALWTPAQDWAGPLAAELERSVTLVLVRSEPRERPDADLDLYHLAGSAEHGFAYRALRQRPGIVLLEDWGLHALVQAETAGRGDAAAYVREARHAHGDTGVFVARQVLGGLGGALPALLAMNQRVLETSLAIVGFSEEVRARARALAPEVPVVFLPLAEPGGAARHAPALLGLVVEVAARAPDERARVAARERAAGPRALALDELRWTDRELGLAEPPADAVALLAGLFGGAR